MKRTKLTPKQRIVAVERLKSTPVKEAMQRGGYKNINKNTAQVGQRLVSVPDNPLSYAYERKSRQLDTLLSVWERFIVQGNNMTLKDAKPSDILRATELMAKHLGALGGEGEKHITNNTIVLGDVQDMTEEQLMGKLSSLRAMAGDNGQDNEPMQTQEHDVVGEE